MKKKAIKNTELLKATKKVQLLDQAEQLELKGGEEFDILYIDYSQWW